MADEIRKISTFEAVDANGRRHTLDEFQKFIETSGIWDTHRSFMPDAKSIRTGSGQPVKRVSQGVYELPDGTRLTSDDPAAP